MEGSGAHTPRAMPAPRGGGGAAPAGAPGAHHQVVPTACLCFPLPYAVSALCALTLLAGAVDLATGGALVRAALVAAEAQADANANPDAAALPLPAQLATPPGRFERAAAWCWLLGGLQSFAGVAGLYGVLARRPGPLRCYQVYFALGLVAISAAQLFSLRTLRPVCEQALLQGDATAGASLAAASAATMSDAIPGAAAPGGGGGLDAGLEALGRLHGTLRGLRRCIDVASALMVVGLGLAWAAGLYCLRMVGALARMYAGGYAVAGGDGRVPAPPADSAKAALLVADAVERGAVKRKQTPTAH